MKILVGQERQLIVPDGQFVDYWQEFSWFKRYFARNPRVSICTEKWGLNKVPE